MQCNLEKIKILVINELLYYSQNCMNSKLKNKIRILK